MSIRETTAASIGETHRNAESVSSLVVDALAAAAGTEPSALEPPLYSVVDPDALDELVGRSPSIRVEFEYDGRSVVVRDGGTVEVDGSVYEPSEEVRAR